MYAKKGKCKSFYSFGAGKNGYHTLEDYLEPDGLDQSRFFYMGSFLVKDFDVRPAVKKRMVSCEPMFLFYFFHICIYIEEEEAIDQILLHYT